MLSLQFSYRQKAGRALFAFALVIISIMGCEQQSVGSMSKAQEFLQNGEIKSAQIELRNLVQKNPHDPRARFVFGLALKESGDYAAAESELRRAMELHYSADEVVPRVAEVMLKLGKAGDMINEFGSTELASREARAELRSLIGEALLSQGQVKDAESVLHKALQESPDNVSAHLGLARIAAFKQDFATAEKSLAGVLSRTPDDHDALRMKASLLLHHGKRNESTAIYERLVAAYPFDTEDVYQLCLLYWMEGKQEEAEGLLGKIMKIAPQSPQALHVQAMVAFRDKKYASAQELSRRLVGRWPNHIPSLVIAGASSYHAGSAEEAVTYLERAVRLDPANTFGTVMLVAALAQARDKDRASREVRNALKRFPDEPSLLMLAGEIAVAENDFSKAAELFKRSQQHESLKARATTRLGGVQLATGAAEQGVRMLMEAVNLDRYRIQPDLTLVVHYLSRKEWDKAAEHIESMDRKQPDSALVPSLRGVIAVAKGNLKDARPQFEKSLNRSPTFLMALEYLARLDLKEGKSESAVKRFETVLAKNPKAESVAVMYSRFLRLSAAPADKVIAPLLSIAKNEPKAVRSRIELANHYLATRQNALALDMATAAENESSRDPAVLAALARAQRAAGELNHAINTYIKLEGLLPKSVEPLLAQSKLFVAIGQQAKALEVLAKAHRVQPGELRIKRVLAQAYLDSGDTDRALELASAIRRDHPKNSAGLALMADALIVSKRRSEAVDLLEQGLREAPDLSILKRLHSLHLQDGRRTQADAVVGKWLGDNPRDVDLRNYLVKKAVVEKDFATAIRYLKEALQSNRNDPYLMNNLAWNLAQQNDHAGALQYAERALKLKPDSPAILDTLGTILVASGEVTRGLPLLKKAVDRAPEEITLRMNYARALIKTGNRVEARNELDLLLHKTHRSTALAEIKALIKQLDAS